MITIVIATHNTLATSLYETSKMICGEALNTKILCMELNENGICEFEDKIQFLAKKQKQDTLIMCDLLGATPFNVCSKYFVRKNHKVMSGVNLPMILSVLLESRNLNIQEYYDIALHFGKEGISSNEKIMESYANDSDEDFL